MAIESTGHSRGNPRFYEVIEGLSKEEGVGPTIWAWPQIIEYLKVAGQPVQGPWPPHQEPRLDPDRPGYSEEPFAVPDPESQPPSPSGAQSGGA